MGEGRAASKDGEEEEEEEEGRRRERQAHLVVVVDDRSMVGTKGACVGKRSPRRKSSCHILYIKTPPEKGWHLQI